MQVFPVRVPLAPRRGLRVRLAAARVVGRDDVRPEVPRRRRVGARVAPAAVRGRGARVRLSSHPRMMTRRASRRVVGTTTMDVLTFPRTVARGFVPASRVRHPAHDAHGVAAASVRGAVVHRRRGDVAVPHGRGTRETRCGGSLSRTSERHEFRIVARIRFAPQARIFSRQPKVRARLADERLGTRRKGRRQKALPTRSVARKKRATML